PLARGPRSRAPRSRPPSHPGHARRPPQRRCLRPPEARAGRVRRADRRAVHGRGPEARARHPAAAAQRGRVLPAAGEGRSAAPAVATRRLTADRWPVLKTAMRWSCVILVALVVGGCGMRKEERHVRTVESNLTAAGFRTLPAGTAGKRSVVENLPSRRPTGTE